MLIELLTIWSNSQALSLGVWLLIVVVVLYLGRTQFHQLIYSSMRSLHIVFRMASRAIAQLEKQLVTRNREVTLAMGKENIEQSIEREFARVNTIVTRDLSHYPELHREIAEIVQQVEEDYQESTDVPPLPPAWTEVVQTITSLPSQADPAVSKVLENIQEAVEDAHDETLKAYQKSSGERHKILSTMQPEWRLLGKSLTKVKTTIDGLEDRSKTIDKYMESYESMRRNEDNVVRTLTSSSITQFFISGMVLFVAALGGIINFQLIAVPMSEMVGGTSYIGSMRTSSIAALVIILIEIAMGLFLLESLRITRLFPVIGVMDDAMRKRMIVISLSILTILAGIEASLAYMRDLLALDREALQQSLAGVGVVQAQFRWIPSIGQMIMGFILPFALAFIAIPLESFIHSLRTVLGLIVVLVLRGLMIVTRLLSGVVNQMSKMLLSIYDLIVVVPLSIEHLIKRKWGKSNNEIKVGEVGPAKD